MLHSTPKLTLRLTRGEIGKGASEILRRWRGIEGGKGGKGARLGRTHELSRRYGSFGGVAQVGPRRAGCPDGQLRRVDTVGASVKEDERSTSRVQKPQTRGWIKITQMNEKGWRVQACELEQGAMNCDVTSPRIKGYICFNTQDKCRLLETTNLRL